MPKAAPPNRLVAAVPNLLSILRLVLAACFPLIAPGWRLPVVVAGGLSDFLDGFVARRFNAGSPSGQLLDGIADKLFVFSVVLTLTLSGPLAWWQMLLVIARDLSVAFMATYVAMRRDWAAFRGLVPTLLGKVTTGLQFAFFATILLWADTHFATVVLTLTALSSAWAAAEYVTQFVRKWVKGRVS